MILRRIFGRASQTITFTEKFSNHFKNKSRINYKIIRRSFSDKSEPIKNFNEDMKAANIDADSITQTAENLAKNKPDFDKLVMFDADTLATLPEILEFMEPLVSTGNVVKSLTSSNFSCQFMTV